MKNKLEKVMIIILIILIIIIAFFTTKKNIKATNDMEILTKNSLFDIIDNIGEIAITCLSTDGNRFFSEEDKIDFTMLYIIKNKEYYKEAIEFYEPDFDECQKIGKINKKYFYNIMENLFSNVDYNINNYKYYKNDYIELCFEPCNYSIFDKKEIVDCCLNDNGYEIIVRYKRNLNELKNKVYVKYDFDFNLKIKSIAILSSILN